MRTKWRYGINSRVPRTSNLHWFIADLDTKDPRKICEFVDYCTKNVSVEYWNFYFTPHGCHFVFRRYGSFRRILRLLLDAPYVDEKFILTGVKRGYWFLETHKPIKGPFEYMKVRY